MPKPLPHLLAYVAIFCILPFANGEDYGCLHGKVIDRTTAQPLKAIVELYSKEDSKCSYSGMTSETGQFSIENLPAGSYLLEVKAPKLMAQSVDVTISTGVDRDLGYIKLGLVSCSEPNEICEPWGIFHNKGKVELPCISGISVLRDVNGLLVRLESDELERRALVKPSPKWPSSAKSGYPVTIYLAVGLRGEVLCALPFDDRGDPDKAALAAIHEWVFQPVLKNGKPIVTTGILELVVP